MALNLSKRQTDAITKIINYTIDDERDHLEEMLYDRHEEEVSQLTDQDLFDTYEKDSRVNDHIWFAIYELQQLIK